MTIIKKIAKMNQHGFHTTCSLSALHVPWDLWAVQPMLYWYASKTFKTIPDRTVLHSDQSVCLSVH